MNTIYPLLYQNINQKNLNIMVKYRTLIDKYYNNQNMDIEEIEKEFDLFSKHYLDGKTLSFNTLYLKNDFFFINLEKNNTGYDVSFDFRYHNIQLSLFKEKLIVKEKNEVLIQHDFSIGNTNTQRLLGFNYGSISAFLLSGNFSASELEFLTYEKVKETLLCDYTEYKEHKEFYALTNDISPSIFHFFDNIHAAKKELLKHINNNVIIE